MGHHYIPQEYLRGFSNDRVNILMYDKKENKRNPAAIKKILQTSGLYSPDLEESLNNNLEKPANAVIRAILNGEILSKKNKQELARFIFCNELRGHIGKNKTTTLLPGIGRELGIEYQNAILEKVKAGEIQQNHAEKHIKRVHEIINKQTTQQSSELWHEVINPERYLSAADEFLPAMGWKLLKFDHKSQLFTSDRPLVYNDRNFGFADGRIELQFPVTADILLQMNWKDQGTTEYKPGSESIARSFNKSMLAGADRFVIFREEKPWMERFFKNYQNQLQ